MLPKASMTPTERLPAFDNFTNLKIAQVSDSRVEAHSSSISNIGHCKYRYENALTRINKSQRTWRVQAQSCQISEIRNLVSKSDGVGEGRRVERRDGVRIIYRRWLLVPLLTH